MSCVSRGERWRKYKRRGVAATAATEIARKRNASKSIISDIEREMSDSPAMKLGSGPDNFDNIKLVYR